MRCLKNWVGFALVVFLGAGGSGSWGSRLALVGSALAQDDLGFDLTEDKKGKKKKPKAKPAPKAAPKAKPGGKDAAGKPGGDDMGFEALDVSVKSPEKEAMEKALDLMKDEDYTGAAQGFYEVYNNPRAKKYFESAEYQLAKALYRMQLYHSSLLQFGKILEKGVEHKYFKTSLEWLFFISHKITDQSEVLKDIARYSDIEFPKKYKDEFLFLLAKYFYFRALIIEREGALGSAPAEVSKDGAKAGGEEKKSKPAGSGDDFGFDLGGVEAEKPAAKGKSDVGDGFGIDLEVEKKTTATALPTDMVGFLSKANALILQVSDKSKFHPRAKYLEGIILYKQSNFQDSVEAFKEVIKILHPRRGKFRDDDLRERAFFQLARVHYEHKQFNYALFYYDKVTRDSESWLESLFESSWAWFRLGKFQKALGNLITLDSPFFREEYFPEGLVLKAVTYYENCRYPESNQIVEEFKSRYEPLYKELENVLSKAKTPESYYQQLLTIQKMPASGKSGKMLRRILNVALADKDLKLVNASVLEIDKETNRIQNASSVFSKGKLGQVLVAFLQKRRGELTKDAGLLTKRRLEQERDNLASLVGQALRIKLENDTAEKNVLLKVQAGEEDLGPALLPYDWSAATDDEKIYWPYRGEYWRDELGTYEYTLTWGCRKQVE